MAADAATFFTLESTNMKPTEFCMALSLLAAICHAMPLALAAPGVVAMTADTNVNVQERAARNQAPNPSVPASVADALPALDAAVVYESRTVTHAGVTETRTFRNRLIRRPGHVWMERVLPGSGATNGTNATHVVQAGHVAAVAETGGHRHVDFDTAIQHLSRSADGAVRADYVDRAERQVVFVPPTEYSVSGFDGSWDNAASMVAEKTVMAMPLVVRSGTPADAEWHAEQRRGWYNRVLWSKRLHIALLVESGKVDGSVSRRTTVALLPATAEAALPWKHLDQYTRKEFDDFMD